MISLTQGDDSNSAMQMNLDFGIYGGNDMVAAQLSGSSNQGHSLTNLIVNYIPTTLSDEDFVKLFCSIGPVRSCKIVRDKASHQSFGFGFCDYTRPEDAKKAIDNLNGLQLQNKTLRVAYARPPENGDPLSTKANVYVQGLPRTVGQNELEQYFGQYGGIIHSKILTETGSGESRGCGFVLFSRRAEAERAIANLNGKPWPGSNDCMLVRFALDPQQKKMKQMGGGHGQQFGMQNQQSQFGAFGGGQNQFGNNAFSTGNLHVLTGGAANAGGPMRPGRANQRNAPYNRGGGPNAGQPNAGQPAAGQQMIYPVGGGQPYIVGAKPRPDEIGTTLYVYNIGPQCQEQTLYNLFATYGTVTKIAVIRDPVRGCTKGYAFVTFQNYQDAANAVAALNGYTLWEKPLQVMFKQPKSQSGGGSVNGGGGLMQQTGIMQPGVGVGGMAQMQQNVAGMMQMQLHQGNMMLQQAQQQHLGGQQLLQ